MLHCEARRPARRGPDGRYIPLSEQDSQLWSLPLIEEAERHLAEASSRGRAGRFQLEAAIQSVHAERARSGRTEWTAIALFYEQLIRISRRSAREPDTPRRWAKRTDLKRGWRCWMGSTRTMSPRISPTGPFALTSCNG
jgi:hypothetical protein